MIPKDEIKYLHTSTSRVLKESIATQDRLEDLKGYVEKHQANNDELINLISELEKSMRKRADLESVVRGIIHHHYEESQE